MPNDSLPEALGKILALPENRRAIAAHITKAIRDYGNYRWVGLYDVDLARGLVSNIALTDRMPRLIRHFPLRRV